MAKKGLLILLLFCVFGSSSIWAWDYPEAQGTLIGGGIGFMLLPWMMDSDDGSINAIAYVFGGVFIAGGLIWMILDIASDSGDSYSSGSGRGRDDSRVPDAPEDFSSQNRIRKSNVRSLLKHFSFGTNGKATHVGLSFRY